MPLDKGKTPPLIYRRHSRSASQTGLSPLSLSTSLPAPSDARQPLTQSGPQSPQHSIDGLSNRDEPFTTFTRGGSRSRSTSRDARSKGSRDVEDGIMDETPNLAHLIQQKRRQASAPFLTSARSSMSFSIGNSLGMSGSTTPGEDTSPVEDNIRRVRSRQPSRLGMSLSALQISGEISPLVIMTPTTEAGRFHYLARPSMKLTNSMAKR